MKSLTIPASLLLIALAGCAGEHGHDADSGHSASTAKAAPAAAAPAAAAPAAKTAESTTMASTATGVTHEAEIGCAGCIYHMEGVTGCSPAVKVDGQVVRLEGGGVDPHGLCAKPQKAIIAGEMKDGTFIATRVEIHE